MPKRFRRPRFLTAALLIGSVWFPAADTVAQDKGLALTRPTARDTQVAKMISVLMPKNHVSGMPLNDTVSSRSLDLFLRTLDPFKLYLEKTDVQEFDRYRNALDDMVKAGDLSVGYYIFNRFLTRVGQRLPMINELLGEEFDFAADDTLITDPDNLDYPAGQAEARERWRKKLKYDLLSLREDDTSMEDAVAKLRRRYQRYATRWSQTDNDDLLEYFLTAITNGFDPHSSYMSPSTLEDFQISMSLNLDGIGAQLQEKDGMTTITRVIPGGAADKHGELKPDDVIVSVGQGTGGETVDIVEMPLSDVVKMIRGPAGTQVRLGVKPGGVGESKEMLITRAKIELGESAARGEVIEHRVSPDAPPVRVGYINLPSFYSDMEAAGRNESDYRSSTRDVRRVLDRFRGEGVDVVVLDLARNGGGSLTEAINLTGLFIDTGPVVQVKDSQGSVQVYDDETPGTAWDGPLAVVTSQMSASASEILAGAIRDYGRGIVVGDPHTHGKGSVQTLMDLDRRLRLLRRNDFGALKMTIQQFYLPDGESTQLRGVPADVTLPSIVAEMDIGEADLKYPLDFDRVPAARHSLYGMVPGNVVEALKTRSGDRIASDEEFQDVQRRIGLYLKQKERKSISLNEEKFRQRREELDAQKEEEEELIEQQIGSEKIYDDNFYNREVLNIAADYVTELRRRNLAQAR